MSAGKRKNMESINEEAAAGMLAAVCDALIEREEELCALDSVVGDGDHGLTIGRGFSAVKAKLPAAKLPQAADTGGLFILAGEILAETMGGAAGPIFGGFFTAMGEAAPGSGGSITADSLAPMFRAGLESVKLIGGAQPGDRTLVDALEPAVIALEDAAKRGASLAAALEASADAAGLGAEATKAMTAKKGRAKFLGEKSRGFKDAGAASMCMMIAAMARYCRQD